MVSCIDKVITSLFVPSGLSLEVRRTKTDLIIKLNVQLSRTSPLSARKHALDVFTACGKGSGRDRNAKKKPCQEK